MDGWTGETLECVGVDEFFEQGAGDFGFTSDLVNCIDAANKKITAAEGAEVGRLWPRGTHVGRTMYGGGMPRRATEERGVEAIGLANNHP